LSGSILKLIKLGDFKMVRRSSKKNPFLCSSRSTAIFFAACAIVTAGPAAADIVLNGDFETGFSANSLGQLVPPGDSALSWTVGGAPVTWYKNGFNNIQQIPLSAHNGHLAIDLAGDGSVRFVRQSLNLLPSQAYQLSFWVGNYSANNSPAGVDIEIRDGTSNTIRLSETAAAPTTNESSTWVRFAFNFIPDGTSNTITFSGANGPSYIGLAVC
jgi:hypothetical protein